jgi:hypothetical protein
MFQFTILRIFLQVTRAQTGFLPPAPWFWQRLAGSLLNPIRITSAPRKSAWRMGAPNRINAMKTYLWSTIVCAALAAQPASFALTAAQSKAARKAIASVTFPELPAKAAELVRASTAADRADMTVLVVQAAIARSRPSAPLVVAAISKAAPELAATATIAATTLEASQASEITVAAVAAAPASQGAIYAAQSKSRGENGDGGNTGGNDNGNGGRGGENTRGDRGPSDPNARGHGRAADIERRAPVAKPDNSGRPPEHSNAGGRFPQHPPHGGKPPGHDENHDGRPDWVDYTRPRGL